MAAFSATSIIGGDQEDHSTRCLNIRHDKQLLLQRASRFKELYDIALHGFRYLKERMWDAQSGGWFRLLDRSGNPLEGGVKHGHGSSYAISACVCCYELTEEQACLELAKTAFGWLEEHAHDSVNGGYFVFYHRDGCPILSESFHGTLRDAIGTPIGCKDANTTSDLLKAFAPTE
jgi:mannobiose 2-epimerase